MPSLLKPSWLVLAEQVKDFSETPGRLTHPVIKKWLAELGAWWTDDETPWCGIAVGAFLKAAGLAIPKMYMRALAWRDWGLPCGQLLGAIAVMERVGGGHVGFLTGVSKDGKRVRLRGGNQDNRWCEAWFDSERIVAYRWPATVSVTGALKAPVAAVGTMSSSEQ